MPKTISEPALAPCNLGVKRQSQKKKRVPRPRTILSWIGHEEEREKLEELAIKYRDADLALARQVSNPIDATVSAWKKPNLPSHPLAKATASAFVDLVDYHHLLVLEKGFNHHLVRQVWSEALNPHPSEIGRCEENLEGERMNAMREDLKALVTE